MEKEILCPFCGADLEETLREQTAELASETAWATHYHAQAEKLQAENARLTAYDGSLAIMPFEEWQTLSAETRARLNVYGLKMETLQKERQWIPVSERLPEPNEHVFIYWQEDNEALRETGFYVVENGRQYWSSLDNAYPLNVTHWQPLPEPPQEQS